MYLDGSSNIDVGDNQSQYTQASVDTIAEFKVLQSGFNAEYGQKLRNGGCRLQTKSGSSQRFMPSTAYEYFRNNALDARSACSATLSSRNYATTSSAGISAAGCFHPGRSPLAPTSASSSFTTVK